MIRIHLIRRVPPYEMEDGELSARMRRRERREVEDVGRVDDEDAVGGRDEAGDCCAGVGWERARWADRREGHAVRGVRGPWEVVDG
jgi:hypothetical protein